jgi:hypothetical protein
MFATTNSPMGMTMGITVNKTVVGPSVVPIPYPSMGQGEMFNPATLFPTVLIQGFMSAVMGSMIAMTEGDEAGEAGGVVSGLVSGPAYVEVGSPSVILGGRPAATQLSTFGTNGDPASNDPAATQVSPSCTNVLFAP